MTLTAGPLTSGPLTSGHAHPDVQDLASFPDLADRLARAITLGAAAYLFARIGMGLLLT